MTSLPTFTLGWQLVDPGPAPVTRQIDNVPYSDDPAELVRLHEQWKQRCTTENERLQQRHESASVVWYPVPRASGHTVVPLFGGTQETWSAAVITVTSALVRSGYRMVRIANLSGLDVLSRFHRLCPSSTWTTHADVASPQGSTIDFFKATDANGLAGIIVDVLRSTPDAQGRIDAGRSKQVLVEVADQLDTPVTFDRLAHALAFALAGRAPVAGAFSTPERTRLVDFYTQQVSQRQHLRDALDRLKGDIGILRQFAPAGHRQTQRYGRGPLRAATIEVHGAGSRTEFEWGREIVAQQVARSLERPRPAGAAPDAFIVLGADDLPPQVLAGMLDAAHRHGHQLLLFFQRVTPRVDEVMGRGTTPHAVFFSLAHPDDREWAAGFLGREFEFVVNGYSLSEGGSKDWSKATTISSDRSVTRTKDFSRLFGGSVSRGFSNGHSESTTSGGGRNWTRTQNVQRSKEYVVEPEVFRDIPEHDMLVVDGRRVTHGCCEPSIRALPITSPTPIVLP